MTMGDFLHWLLTNDDAELRLAGLIMIVGVAGWMFAPGRKGGEGSK